IWPPRSCSPPSPAALAPLSLHDALPIWINVQVGQRVQPGQFVGQSGTYNGGHVHVEVRKYTPGATSSGYTAVDPRSYFEGGSFSSAGGVAMSMVQNAAQKALSDFKRLQTFNRAGLSVGSQVGSMFSSLFGW